MNKCSKTWFQNRGSFTCSIETRDHIKCWSHYEIFEVITMNLDPPPPPAVEKKKKIVNIFVKIFQYFLK